MISVDTGPAHAAAALGVPLVVLYGAESPAYWLPRGPAGTAVVGLGGPPHSTRVDQLSVEAVFEAWRSLPPRGQAAGGLAEPRVQRSRKPRSGTVRRRATSICG